MIATRTLTVLFGLLAFTTLLGTTSSLPAPYDPHYFGSSSDQSVCSLKSAQLPNCGNQGSCLTPPPFTGTLVAVALGVGTQNYTCSSSTAAPTPNGALATLYDISCPISTVSSAAHFLTELAFKANVFNDYPIPSGLGYEMIGNHYFTSDAKSAVFEFTPNNSNNKFKFVGGKVENITAPSYAVDGSVDWLILGRTAGLEYLSHDVKWVYRVFTAGGKAPATCKGLGQRPTVHYAAEYWFYN